MSKRRDFLLAAGVAALAAAPSGCTARSTKGGAPVADLPDLQFDNAKFEALLRRPARHRQCFGATELQGGSVLDFMSRSIEAYAVALREGPRSLRTAAVTYHGDSVMLGYGNKTWNTYVAPYLRNSPEPSTPPLQQGQGNPYYKHIQELATQNGALLIVCHSALRINIMKLANAVNQPARKVYDAVMADILPYATLVPAGVMAINACQEKKFTYLQVSV